MKIPSKGVIIRTQTSWKDILKVVTVAVCSPRMSQFLNTFDNVHVYYNVFDPVFDGFVDNTEQMTELHYRSIKIFFHFNISSGLWRRILKAYRCCYNCRCLEIMQSVRKQYINKIVQNENDFQTLMAERMGYNSSYRLKYLRYQWSFGFFLEKVLINRIDNYLGILNPNFNKLTPAETKITTWINTMKIVLT